MRSNVVLGVIAAGILIFLALLALLLGTQGAATSDAGAEERPGAAPGALEPPLPSVASGEEEPARVSVSAERAEVARSEATQDTTCLVRVVLASSGASVPDAQVWMQREDVDWQGVVWRTAMRRFNDVEPVLQSGLGRELELDARGEVRVPRPSQRLSLAAAHGELHGEATLEADAATCVIELEAYHALHCEVVDRSNRPVAGASVALCWGELDPFEQNWTGITGEDGRVWIPKLEEQISPDDYGGTLQLSLAGGVPCEPESFRFTMDSVPAVPVRLVAEDFGRLRVQLTDGKGVELELGGYAWAELCLESSSDPSPADRASTFMPLDAGRADLGCVGLGLTIEVGVSADGHGSVWREVQGPTVPGEELRLLIPIGERRTSARGHVQGIQATFGDREPPGARLDGRLSQDGAFFSDWVQENEVFEAPIALLGYVRGELPRLDVPWTLDLSHDGGPALRMSVVPTLEEGGAVLDFGDLVFAAQPELARLLVTDDSEKPVQGAAVEVSSEPGRARRYCDGGGRYLFAGQSTELPLKVRATHASWLPSEWAEIEEPGSELTLVLQRGAALTGSLLLPPSSHLDALHLELGIEPSAASPEGKSYLGWLVVGGRFRFQVCELGRAKLTVFLADDRVFEREDIELRAGETTELDPIDLRAAVHAFELSFELRSGEPWRGGHLELREPDGELSSWVWIGPSARVRFLALRPSVDLWVAGRKARPVLFENVRNGERLVLQDAPSVVLRLPGDVERPEPPLALLVRGERILPETVPFEADDDMDIEDAVVGEEGTAHLWTPWPGDYALSWFVRHNGTGVDFAIQQPEAQTIHVPEPPSSPIVEAELTRDEVAQAVLEAGG